MMGSSDSTVHVNNGRIRPVPLHRTFSCMCCSVSIPVRKGLTSISVNTTTTVTGGTKEIVQLVAVVGTIFKIPQNLIQSDKRFRLRSCEKCVSILSHLYFLHKNLDCVMDPHSDLANLFSKFEKKLMTAYDEPPKVHNLRQRPELNKVVDPSARHPLPLIRCPFTTPLQLNYSFTSNTMSKDEMEIDIVDEVLNPNLDSGTLSLNTESIPEADRIPNFDIKIVDISSLQEKEEITESNLEVMEAVAMAQRDLSIAVRHPQKELRDRLLGRKVPCENPGCKKLFDSIDLMLTHFYFRHNSRDPCGICGKPDILKSGKTRRKHIRSHMNDMERLSLSRKKRKKTNRFKTDEFLCNECGSLYSLNVDH